MGFFFVPSELLKRARKLGKDYVYLADSQIFKPAQDSEGSHALHFSPQQFKEFLDYCEALWNERVQDVLGRRHGKQQRARRMADDFQAGNVYIDADYARWSQQVPPEDVRQLIAEMLLRKEQREASMRDNIRVMLATGEWKTTSPAMKCLGCDEMVSRVPGRGYFVDAEGKHHCKGRKRPAGTAVVHQRGATPAAHP